MALLVSLLALWGHGAPAATAAKPASAGSAARAPRALPTTGRASRLSTKPALKRTVLLAQRMFQELGYPLGRDRPGELGVRTRGALAYFQRKYGLNASGYPDARTLTLMASVEASLHAGSNSAPAPTALVPAVAAPSPSESGTPQSQPRDLVERVLGNDLPYLAIALALAAIVALLALGDRGALDYDLPEVTDSGATPSVTR